MPSTVGTDQVEGSPHLRFIGQLLPMHALLWEFAIVYDIPLILDACMHVLGCVNSTFNMHACMINHTLLITFKIHNNSYDNVYEHGSDSKHQIEIYKQR